MNPMALGAVLEIGKSVIDRFIPDAEAKRKAEAEFLSQAMQGDFKQVMAQLEINAREAAHPSIWVSGGRPLFFWIGGAGFAYATIIQPILVWFARIKGWPEPPDVNVDLLWPVILGLLGLGGFRTYEKKHNVASK